MKMILLACAELTLLDANSNRVSLINIYEELSSAQFPFLIPYFSVLAITKKEDGEEDEGSCAIKVSLGDEAVLETDVLVHYEGGEIHRSIISLQGLVITSPGTLKLQLLHNSSEIGYFDILVKQLTPAIIVNGQEA